MFEAALVLKRKKVRLPNGDEGFICPFSIRKVQKAHGEVIQIFVADHPNDRRVKQSLPAKELRIVVEDIGV